MSQFDLLFDAVNCVGRAYQAIPQSMPLNADHEKVDKPTNVSMTPTAREPQRPLDSFDGAFCLLSIIHVFAS